MPTYTYRFPTHWTTTDEELDGYIDRFEVTPEEKELIDEGGQPEVVLEIKDPISEEDPT